MATDKLKIGSKAPDFNLLGVDNKFYSLDSFADKKILIVIFSCNHCPYVQAYEQRIISIQKEFSEKGVQIVAINSNEDKNYPEDSFDEMIKRSNEKQFNFPYLRDETQEVAKAYFLLRNSNNFSFQYEQI
jgi:peroxiredoxin